MFVCVCVCVRIYIYIYIYIYIRVHTYIVVPDKMADDVQDDIENALNQIASTTERSGNMKKELKQTIYQTVSKLRKLFATLIDVENSKTIAELEKTVASNKVEIGVAKRSTLTVPSTPLDTGREPLRTSAREVAPSGNNLEKRQAETVQTRLYSDALKGKCKQERYMKTVTSRDKESTASIKDILKSKIKPAEIKVGINSLKTLRNGTIQIETGSKEEIDILMKDINEKCEGILEAKLHTLRRPKLVIYNVPEDISVQNIEKNHAGSKSRTQSQNGRH